MVLVGREGPGKVEKQKKMDRQGQILDQGGPIRPESSTLPPLLLTSFSSQFTCAKCLGG